MINENHARNSVLQLGSIITLYLSTAFLLVLFFSIINLVLPDEADGYWLIESNVNSVRTGIAMLIVFFPVFLFLTKKVNQIRKEENTGPYSGFTKWLIYLSLLIGGGIILGDLVVVIFSFLNGEITSRFLLKAGVLLVVVGLVFYYYLLDVQNYWSKNENKSKMFGRGFSAVVFCALVMGFFHIETPSTVREIRLDEKQVQDLQEIQARIEGFLQVNDELPESLDDVYDGQNFPKAPSERKEYEYKITDKGFALCAEFSLPVRDGNTPAIFDTMESKIKGQNNWSYKAGQFCFERVVNLGEEKTE